MGELIFEGLLALFFTAMIPYANKIIVSSDLFGTRLWPLVIVIAAAALLWILLILEFRKIPKTERKISSETFAFDKTHRKGTIRLLIMIALFLAYALMLEVTGFIITTYFFCIGSFLVFGERKLWKLLVYPFILLVPVYAIFVYGLNIRLPRGTGVFRDFSKFFEYLF